MVLLMMEMVADVARYTGLPTVIRAAGHTHTKEKGRGYQPLREKRNNQCLSFLKIMWARFGLHHNMARPNP